MRALYSEDVVGSNPICATNPYEECDEIAFKPLRFRVARLNVRLTRLKEAEKP